MHSIAAPRFYRRLPEFALLFRPAPKSATPVAMANSTLAIAAIRPTQMTAGFREVAEKRRRWNEAKNVIGSRKLEGRAVPVVVGPNLAHYALDRHHWLCALTAEGVKHVAVVVVADLSKVSETAFWSDLDGRGWCRPIDAHGRRRDYFEIPSSMSGLSDDPFRSLASALRRAGGYSKDKKLFSEFALADELRRLMRAEDLDEDFEAAVQAALILWRDVASPTTPFFRPRPSSFVPGVSKI